MNTWKWSVDNAQLESYVLDSQIRLYVRQDETTGEYIAGMEGTHKVEVYKRFNLIAEAQKSACELFVHTVKMAYLNILKQELVL